MLELHDIPGTFLASTVMEAHDAGDEDNHNIWKAPFDSDVTKVSVVPNDDVTGDNTDNYILTVVNRGDDGSGTAELDDVEFATGTDEEEGVERTLYESSEGYSMDAGEILDIERTISGSGLASPSYLVNVEFEGR